MLAVDCGEVGYEEALAWQRRLVAARAEGTVDDVLLTLTHPAVYTAGSRADVRAHVLDRSATRHIPLVATDRGGDVTYHGPGQLVVYPILRVPHAKAVRPYVEGLERAVVAVAASFGIEARGATDRGRAAGAGRPTTRAGRTRPRTGVWVGDFKLAAIGIKIHGRVTSHGLSLNVDPDLDHFSGIVPCGIRDGGVCSLASLGVPARERPMATVRERLVAELSIALDRPVREGRLTDVGLAPSVR